MSELLLKNFFMEKDLIDIGGSGVCTQSSISKWSRHNDAQRAVNGKSYKDYAFHTNKEKNPWWQIEFDSPRFIEYIVINNRKRKPYDEKACPLSITAYDNNNEEILVSLVYSFFSDEIEGIPLIVYLKGKTLIKKVKVSLLKEDFLHLSSIRFLSKSPLANMNKNLVFVANRNDGLGERLKALINAMVLAKKTNGNFLFTWNTKNEDFHAVSEKDTIFNKAFQKKYLSSKEVVQKLKLYPMHELTNLNNQGLETYDGLLVQQIEINKMLSYPYSFDKSDYKDAFNKVGFSDELITAKNYAEDVSLSNNSVAIHIRAGDIVYGVYKNEPNFYAKVIPLYLLDYVIKTMIRNGSDIVIFGQDDDLCSHMAKKYQCLYSKNLIGKDFNDSQVAIFDIVLMSRCRDIIAGPSGFAVLAEWIGNCNRTNCYQYISSSKNALEEFERFLADKNSFIYSSNISPLLKSFTISQFVYRFKDDLDLPTKINFIKMCINLDSDNFYHILFLASLYYQNGEDNQGDILLADMIEKKGISPLKKISIMVHWTNTTPLSRLVDVFNLAAGNGSIMASIVLLINDIYYNKNVDMRVYEEILKKNKNSKIGSVILSQLLKDLT